MYINITQNRLPEEQNATGFEPLKEIFSSLTQGACGRQQQKFRCIHSVQEGSSTKKVRASCGELAAAFCHQGRLFWYTTATRPWTAVTSTCLLYNIAFKLYTHIYYRIWEPDCHTLTAANATHLFTILNCLNSWYCMHCLCTHNGYDLEMTYHVYMVTCQLQHWMTLYYLCLF